MCIRDRHHVLIQPGHGNHGEGAGEELLEEVLLAVHIVEEEDAGPVSYTQLDVYKRQAKHYPLFFHLHGGGMLITETYIGCPQRPRSISLSCIANNAVVHRFARCV